MIPRFTRLETATAVVAAAQAAVALFVLRTGVDQVPMHFNAAGQVDRWGDSREAAGVILFIAAITAVTGFILALGVRDPKADDGRRRALGWAQVILLASTTIVVAMMMVLASGAIDAAAAGPQITLMACCTTFAVIGAVVGKVPPNAIVGVRTPWSLSSRLAWEKSNRLAGRLFFWGGLAGLIAAPYAPQDLAMKAMISAVLLAAAICVFESWRVWRADPERRLV